MSKAVYKLSLSMRGAELEGMFVLEAHQYEEVMATPEIALGEVAGKHSDVSWGPEPHELLKISENPVIVDFIEKNPCGINPFDYLYDEDEDY